MNLIQKYTIRFIYLSLIALATVSAYGQDARLHFEKLNGLETRAKDVVEVNVDGKLLELAKRVTAKVNDADAKTIGQAISGLKGIYVRVYNFEKDNEYNMGDVDEIRNQLTAPGWEKVANVRSKKNEQKVDVYTMFTGDVMSGVAVVISESKSIALVNVIGPIDIETLVQLSGRMNIPKIDIDGSVKTKKVKE